MDTKVRNYVARNFDELIEKIQSETETYKIIERKTVRQRPLFWKKEIHAKVEIADAPKVKTEMKSQGNTLNISVGEEKKNSILEILEGKKDPKLQTKTDYYSNQSHEVETMKTMMKQMMDKMETTKDLDDKRELLKQEEEKYFIEFKDYLLQEDVESTLANEIIEELKNDIKMIDWDKREYILEKLEEKIESNIKVSQGFDLENSKIVALVGPTGVGKTTTLAKIAGNLKYQGKKIGLITTDVYRIGAVDQLEIYAKILSSNIKPASNPEELKDAIDYFLNVEKVDHILIDTVGRSPMDPDSIEGMKEYIEVSNADHVGLVLSATQKQRDVMRILNNFSGLDLDSVVFTKLDETLSYGVILNAVVKGNVKVSYITDGQNVPMDIYTANAKEITQKILNGVEGYGPSSRTS